MSNFHHNDKHREDTHKVNTEPTDQDIIGAMVKLKWLDSGETHEQLFISFEEFPEGAPEDDYILPKALIRDDQVFTYSTLEEFAEVVEKNSHPEFEVIEFVLVTDQC